MEKTLKLEVSPSKAKIVFESLELSCELNKPNLFAVANFLIEDNQKYSQEYKSFSFQEKAANQVYKSLCDSYDDEIADIKFEEQVVFGSMAWIETQVARGQSFDCKTAWSVLFFQKAFIKGYFDKKQKLLKDVEINLLNFILSNLIKNNTISPLLTK